MKGMSRCECCLNIEGMEKYRLIQYSYSNNNSIDIVKTICCILIIGSHCLPVFTSDMPNYYYGQWLFRFCVPFFFLASGYFYAKMDTNRKKSYIKRIVLIYVISTAIYFPLFCKESIFSVGRNLLFGYHHLWYMSSLALGLILILVADKVLKNRKNYLILALVGGGTVR